MGKIDDAFFKLVEFNKTLDEEPDLCIFQTGRFEIVEFARHDFTDKKKYMFSPGIEPGTFCVLDRCDNRYTTKTCWL